MIKPKITRVLFFLTLVLTATASAQDFNIKTYGAVSNRQTNNAPAIQKAVDACYLNGGGRVLVPAGTFVTGTIHLKSNVHL